MSITGMLADLLPLASRLHMSIHILSTSKTHLLGVRGPKLTWQGIPELLYPRVDVQAHRLNMPWHQSTPALLPCG